MMMRIFGVAMGCQRRYLNINHRKFPSFLDYCHKLESSDLRSDVILSKLLRDPLMTLNEGLEALKELKVLLKDGHDNDPEMSELAQQEIQELEENLNGISKEIAESILKKRRKFDSSDAKMEIVPGAGGLEASLFAMEIYNLYSGFITKDLGCQIKVQEMSTVSLKSVTGLQKGSFIISGNDVFKKLKHECGVHRIQRVPISGTKCDRMQTSTCSVAIIPIMSASSTKVEILEKDIKVETRKSSGPGGQSVNTTDSAVRIYHIPTKIVVDCQEGRTAIINKEIALTKLKNILYEKEFEKEMRIINSSRKSQIGNMNRNEKIRTYNFMRNSIVDHRLGLNKQVESISTYLKGELGYEILHEFYRKLDEIENEEELLMLL